MFHAATVTDLRFNPLPPPHPEITKYFEPPRKVQKRAKASLATCKEVFNIKQGTFLQNPHCHDYNYKLT